MKAYHDNGKVGYAFVVADLIHIGHLKFFENCKKYCDFLIVGVYTDGLTESYKRKPIIPFEQRMEMVKALKVVDMVVTVKHRSCVPMLKKLTCNGWKISYLFHGSDWSADKDPDLKSSKKYIESIGGQLIQPQYTEGISTSKIIAEIIHRNTAVQHKVDIKQEG